MSQFSRRKILAAGAAGGALTATAAAHAAGVFGNPDMPPQGQMNSTPGAFAEPGPQDPVMASQVASFGNPPPTDVGGLPAFWSSFNLAPKRVQGGGWARQVNTEMFPISKDIAGVNMRLGAGGIRELHWHQQAEWAVMVYGSCRVTAVDQNGHAFVDDVKAGDLWYFPAGVPHSLQGLGPDGCEFVIAFDNGASSENNTLLVSEWIAHTPPEVLAKNFGVPESAFANIPLQQRWIFQGKVPGPLANDVNEIMPGAGPVPNPFVFRLSSMKPNKQTKSGMVQIQDSTNFKAATTVASALVTVKPGGMREMHWHPTADEWQYFIKGTGRMTLFNVGPKAITADFNPGDVGYVPKNFGHYVENTGTDDLVFMEIFKTNKYEEISLTDWLAHTPSAMVQQTLNLSPETIAKFSRTVQDVVPA
ncbi:MAG TPA: cupin domain-containing protein [Acidocella sp.]|jgi:oxalate decarboxylase|uniref:cupin domain-containing protein n=1 Tax=Acidocella sp. TaxID=50710 RepID=UPI002CB93AE9|nr:cupin domain-containing protein [Acidocella sp.]HVE22098.1 cupin domain-containing protein [Acidocella sp.]